MILISYLVDEMVSAEVRLDRMLQGGKEVKRAMNKYRKLLVETHAMKDKYTLGHYRTKAEYLMAVGHKVVRINEELRGTVEVATAEKMRYRRTFLRTCWRLKLWNNLTDQGFWQLDFPAGLLWIQIRPPDPDQSGCLPESKRELRSKKEA